MFDPFAATMSPTRIREGLHEMMSPTAKRDLVMKMSTQSLKVRPAAPYLHI